jgi:hypothetical protein
MKKKCYISGKITGTDMAETCLKFEAAKKEVAIMGFEAISPLDLPHNHDGKWEQYMRECLRAMLDCNILYLLNGWENSPGATVKHQLARTLGMAILQESGRCAECSGTGNMSIEKDTVFIPCIFCGGDGIF